MVEVTDRTQQLICRGKSRMASTAEKVARSPVEPKGPSAQPCSSTRAFGYTHGMKVAISIPNALFERAERLRRQEQRSRSALFAVALTEYIARHASDEVTQAMNRVCADVDTEPDGFLHAASKEVLERSEW